MKKKSILSVLLFVFVAGFCLTLIMLNGDKEASSTHIHLDDHDHFHFTGHSHDHSVVEAKPDVLYANMSKAKLVTGQGDFIFSWDKKLTKAFPKDAVEFEPQMHGGFNEDPETGIVYTGIPGYGLCSISADLKKWKKIGTDDRLKDNIHGIVFFVHKGQKYLAVAQNGIRVLVLNLDGSIVSEILKPTGNEFDFVPVNDYYVSEKNSFGITDVTYLDGIIYASTGYSKGDFILTIKENEGEWSWGKLAWGGKGKAPGQFQTAHGVYAHDDHIFVANRAAGQVVKFGKDGRFVEMFENIPAKSLVCNVSFKAEHFFFNALSKIGDQKSAPIYAHTGSELVSTIIPGDLEIPILNNIHHVWPHFVEKKNGSKQLYLLVHGWNKGKYAVLKLEK